MCCALPRSASNRGKTQADDYKEDVYRHRITLARTAVTLALLGCMRNPVGHAEAAQPSSEAREASAPAARRTSESERAQHPEAEYSYSELADAPLFLPKSYLYWGTPVGDQRHRVPLVFALEYALHLPIFSDLRGKVLAGKRWAGAVTLSFEGALRMLARESKPVRMPSYRPVLSGQLFHIFNAPHPMVSGLRLGFYHYSNGQEHCTFSRELPDESAACDNLTAQVTDPQQALNRHTGNFSMNGWLTELFTRVHWLDGHGVSVADLTFGLKIVGILKRGLDPTARRVQQLYGWGQLSLHAGGAMRLGWARLSISGQGDYFPAVHGSAPRAAGRVELLLQPYWLTGFGFFARYYGGRDFYNAFFLDRIQQFAAGLSWDGTRPLIFATH